MCGSCDPDTLLAEVDVLEGVLEPLYEASGTSAFETERMRIIQGRMRRKMSGAVRSFQGGKIDAATLERRFSSAINGAYPDAYQIGVGQWPRAQVTGADRDFLRRSASAEMGFASGFVKDIAGGKLSEKQVDARLDQYVLGAESVKTSGWARKSPSETVFRWDLGLAAHCSDCLLLSASSPFKRDELPTVPRGGDTQCLVSPTALVKTHRGDVPIADVAPGDLVWTHRSRWRRVLAAPRTRSEDGRGVVEVNGTRLTADHRLWTLDGWRSAEHIGDAGLYMLHLQHAKDLCELLGDDALGSPYEHLPTVRERLRVWNEEGSARGSVPVLRDEREGSRAVGESRVARAHHERHRARVYCEAHALRRSDRGELLQSTSRGWASMGVLLGWRQEAHGLLLPMGLGTSQRAYPGGDGDPPRQPRSDRRSAGEPRARHVEGASHRLPCVRHRPDAGGQGVGPFSGSRLFELWEALQGASVPAEDREDHGRVLHDPLPEGVLLYDLSVEEDHSFFVEGFFAANCRSRCKCELVVVADSERPRREVQVNTIDPEATSGVKRVGNRTPTRQERARVDDLRSRINYHRRRIETAPTEAARKAAIAARREANSELIIYQQQRGISDVPMLDVGEVISGTQITVDVAEGLAVRGIDGTTILLADAEEWSATTASLLERIEELLNEGG